MKEILWASWHIFAGLWVAYWWAHGAEWVFIALAMTALLKINHEIDFAKPIER